MVKTKQNGQVYTPIEVIREMLDMVLFNLTFLPDIIIANRRHIIDNSCGDGRMLMAAVERACEAYKTVQISKADCISYLEECVHGIELDPVEWALCIKNLNNLVESYGLPSIKWDIRNCDALSCHDFDGKMDFIIGNPPYVRVHNLDIDSIKDYSFAKGGMTDLYLAFYELGFKMLNPDGGRMVYISPSSWFTSVAGQGLRDYILKRQNLVAIKDYGHMQIFEGAQTYVAISLFTGDGNIHYPFYTFVPEGKEESKPLAKYLVDGKFYFGDTQQLELLRGVMGNKTKAFRVKNGYATLADDVFITENTLIPQAPEWEKPNNKYLRYVVKASTGVRQHMIYPYDENGKLVSEEELKTNSPNEYHWLAMNKERLLSRATDYEWYAFGRSQAINDTYSFKYSVSSIVSDKVKVKIKPCGVGNGVYGGLYILPLLENDRFEEEDWLKYTLWSDEFFSYVKSLRKYKSGGYYTFSSKDLENYLNYKWCGKK